MDVSSEQLSAGWRRVLARGLNTRQTLRGLLAVGLFTCGAMMVMQDDSWWHLRCGQLIWQEKCVPSHDPFSYALPAGTHWPNHEWLAQLLFYGVYTLGGLTLLNLAGACVLTLAGLFMLNAMAGGIQRRFVLLLLVLPWIVAALSVRPQVFTLLGLSLMVWLLVRERYWPIPVVFLVWANLHGAVVLGGLAMVGCCLSAAVFDRGRLARLLVATALSGAATLVTPLGFEIVTFPIESVSRLKQLDLTEWNAPGFVQWDHLYFWALLAAFWVASIVRWRRLDRWPDRMLVVLGALFSVMGMMSARNIPLFLIVAAIAASRLGPDVDDGEKARDFERKNLGVLGAFAAVAAAAIAVAFCLPWRRLEWEPMSDKAIAAVRACPQPMFNTYNTGGYLLWFLPERKVFLDSRQDPYPIELLVKTIRAQQTGDYAALFDQHGIRSAVMEPIWPLGRKLIEDGWRKIYQDDRWVVLTRPD